LATTGAHGRARAVTVDAKVDAVKVGPKAAVRVAVVPVVAAGDGVNAVTVVHGPIAANARLRTNNVNALTPRANR
jgi:hypothetical protein